MKPEIKKLWVEALRSGRFTQGIMALQNNDKTTGQVTNCCLGVACHLALEAGVALTLRESGTAGTTHTITFFDEEVGTLPAAVQEWMGLDSKEGKLPEPVYSGKYNHEYNDLIGLNDRGFTFLQIADIIDEKL